MIGRYENPAIAEIWSDAHKLSLWQRTELAVLQARVELGTIPYSVWLGIAQCLDLQTCPIDIEWWGVEDARIHHDLNAFVHERARHLPPNLEQHFHEALTSYDVEESAFNRMLLESTEHVAHGVDELDSALRELACEHRFTIMMGKTHGQEAELQTFGKRVLTWIAQLQESMLVLERAAERLYYSKLSGPCGNYTGIDMKLERRALEILGFKPFYGATQILPREIHAPAAQALCQIVQTLDKIADDIRLSARSGRPINQEPFRKEQTGSSSMPHKRNTIRTEQLEGMGRMARGYLNMILENIRTWEERAIEQSCVERVAWPDLFHVVMQSLKQVQGVISRLQVYPDTMLQEIVENRGCYAGSTVKDWLRKRLSSFGIGSEAAYRIVQLAAFLVHEPSEARLRLRNTRSRSLAEADQVLVAFTMLEPEPPDSIQDIILQAELSVSSHVAATQEDVDRWNHALRQVFAQQEALEEWEGLFAPSHLLREEQELFNEILGDE